MHKYIKNTLISFALAAGLAGGTGALADTFNARAASPYADPATLKNNEILHLPTGTKTSKEQFFETIESARVIYIGELHDNPEAHRVQLEIIRALNEKFPGKIAVGMEMFRRDSQPELDAWRDKKLSDTDFKDLYCRNWGEWYSAYEPVFDYMKEQSITAVALKASKETEKKFKQGLTHADSPDIPEVDESDIHHKPHFMSFFQTHDGQKMPNADKYYRVMAMWDDAMAQSVADFLDNPENADKKLIVLAGTGHVEFGFGIPKRAFRRHPHDYQIVITTPDSTQPTTGIPLISGDFAWKIPEAHVPSGQCLKPQ